MKNRGKGDIENDEEILLAESALPPTALEFQDSKGISSESDRLSMYEAAVDGDSGVAMKLLMRDPSLACHQQITETGDRALHVAVYKKRTKLVRDLVACVEPSDLELHDGRGYSACCYAATTGVVEIANILMDKNANLSSKRNSHGTTPLQLAVFRGNTNLALKFIQEAQVDHLLEHEWVDLLLLTIHSKMYDVALAILGKDGSLAVKKGVDQQTALHVMAQLDLSSGWKYRDHPEMKSEVGKLVEKVWAEIKKVGRESVVELIKNPPILRDAAKVGNVDLILMITNAYPELLGHTNDEGHTIFHFTVMYQQQSMLELMKQPEKMIEYNSMLGDADGNNLLHLAGKSLPPDALKTDCEPDAQIRKERAWFEEVEKIVPPYFAEKRNKEGCKPIEVFRKEHKGLFEESAKRLKSTAESGILVATIIMTVVFAAAFTPPGGYDQTTGKPLIPTSEAYIQRNSWFVIYVIFDVLALFFSTFSILLFWSILSSHYEQDQLFRSHSQLKAALTLLLLSLLCAISTFLSAFFLVVWKQEDLFKSIMIPTYIILMGGISFHFFKLFPNARANLIKKYTNLRLRITLIHGRNSSSDIRT